MFGDGGGRQNFSPSVCLVAATAAQSIYYFPRSDLASTVIASRALDAGSARGYGTLQSMGATEMLVDEVAAELKLDPDRTAPAQRVHVRHEEHAGRDSRVARSAPTRCWPDAARIRCGSSVRSASASTKPRIRASATASASAACRRISAPAPKRHSPRSSLVARRPAAAAPHRHRHGHRHGDQPVRAVHALARQTGRRDAHRRDPMAGAADVRHRRSVADAAGRAGPQRRQSALDAALRQPQQRQQFGVLLRPCHARGGAPVVHPGPVARGLGDLEPGLRRRPAGAAGRCGAKQARWIDGKLTAGGLAPLPLQQLVAKAFELGLATGAIVHTFNRWQWAEAEFPLDGEDARLPLDGIALRWGDGQSTTGPKARRPPTAIA